MQQEEQSTSTSTAAGGGASAADILARRKKQADDAALLQNFQLPERLPPPKWLGMMDGILRDAKAARDVSDANWVRRLPAAQDAAEAVAGSRWATALADSNAPSA